MAAPLWAPSVGQVAAILRARTRGKETIAASSAREQGTFTATTRPTAAQVTELIELACGDVAAKFAGRSPCTDSLRISAASAAAYRAAQLVEISYFPERASGEGTAFAALGELWRDAAASVAAAVVESCPLDNDPDPSDDGGALAPSGRGPCGPLIGRKTVW